MVPALNSIEDHCSPPALTPAGVTEGDQDYGRVALARPVAFGRLDQALDLEFGQVLAIPAHLTVTTPAQLTLRNSDSGDISRRYVLAMIFCLCPRVDWA